VLRLAPRPQRRRRAPYRASAHRGRRGRRKRPNFCDGGAANAHSRANRGTRARVHVADFFDCDRHNGNAAASLLPAARCQAALWECARRARRARRA